jgi:hypothetical protein
LRTRIERHRALGNIGIRRGDLWTLTRGRHLGSLIDGLECRIRRAAPLIAGKAMNAAAAAVWRRRVLKSLSASGVGDVNWRVKAVADVNGDGKPDLLWQHLTQGWVAVWTMNGATRIEGHLVSPHAIPAVGPWSEPETWIRTGTSI